MTEKMGNKNTEKNIQRPHRIEHWQWVAGLLMLYDILAVNLSYFLALFIRFDGAFSKIPLMYLMAYLEYIPINTVICIAVFIMLHLYKSIWRFASYSELWRTFFSTVITSCTHIIGITLLFRRMPVSYYLIGAVFQFIFMIFIRFSYRFVLLERRRLNGNNRAKRRAMIIGAGSAGTLLIQDISHAEESDIRVCCIIDDNPNKQGRYIDGVPIVGGRDDILLNADKYKIETILIAIPSASASDKREIVNICKETGCELKILPGMYQFVSGSISIKSMENVSVEDLLGREPIRVDLSEICGYLEDKTVLVTGGGGSIGSELCRQIARSNPKQLIIFDIYENKAYDIQQELIRSFRGELDLKVLIGSVRDKKKLDYVFKTYKPDIVFHAAAHKHVPLMEDSPCEAIKNNSMGTYYTALAAVKHKTKKFVLISTDKAVNPTNVMGASKRLCEMIVQSMNKTYEGKTEFVAVRFGNVLGSNGSVIPLFKKQIEHGGPVTVTHPEIIRYFMTIPEAVSLVLQAGVYAKGGEVFILDMGEPMKIDTLARNLIKLSGFKPDVDIPIIYSGLRPGEKLYEEKLMDSEGLQRTPNDLIHIAHPLDFDRDTLVAQAKELFSAAEKNDEENIRELIKEMVHTYHPDNEDEMLSEKKKEA